MDQFTKYIIIGIIIFLSGVFTTIAFQVSMEGIPPIRNTYVCAGEISDRYVDGTMASLDFVNGTCKGITFFPHWNECYESFDFGLLEMGAMYTFTFHLEDDVARPGIEMYYIDDAPVIDNINRGYHVDYWVDDRGAEIW